MSNEKSVKITLAEYERVLGTTLIDPSLLRLLRTKTNVLADDLMSETSSVKYSQMELEINDIAVSLI
jgi:uncharacterized iron-regulated protein